MNELFIEIAHRSLSKHKEILCGDHVEVLHNQNEQIVVLADGLGSGVKASILSTLTTKIISTMVQEGLSLQDCIETIAHTLPICKTRDLAYSTFTIMHFKNAKEVEIIQYDNPHVILLRNGEVFEFYKTETVIADKRIYHSRVSVKEHDVFIAMSDGCIHAGVEESLNFGWQREHIIDYMKVFCPVDLTSQTLVKILLDQCLELYGNKPGDDTTACVIRVKKRQPLNLMIGPPKNPSSLDRMMSLFFAKEGKHIVCGGTTSQLASKHLKKEIIETLDYVDPEIPPVAKIEGIDLVTEGVITINRVLSYAKDYLKDNQSYQQWGYKKDGASLIAKMLFEDATDIHFYVGQAINPAHQNPDLPIHFSIKMQLVKELTECLKKMGKHILVSYF